MELAWVWEIEDDEFSLNQSPDVERMMACTYNEG
jgi:hypothetical protein